MKHHTRCEAPVVLSTVLAQRSSDSFCVVRGAGVFLLNAGMEVAQIFIDTSVNLSHKPDIFIVIASEQLVTIKQKVILNEMRYNRD